MSVFEEREELRDSKDWIESEEFKEIYESYKKSHQDSSLETQATDLTIEGVQNWYYNRTLEIENLTGLVEVALNFAELAIVNGCKNINELIESLRTLYTLAYECNKPNKSDEINVYTLDYVSKLNESERLNLIMSHAYESTHELYVKNLQKWLLPFILRQPTLKQRENLLRGL